MVCARRRGMARGVGWPGIGRKFHRDSASACHRASFLSCRCQRQLESLRLVLVAPELPAAPLL
eukprot:61697-Hanusia_phi.AAC.1